MKRMSKRAQWQNYLLPAILAVIVLGISMYFIFNEAFTSGDIDREVCKESIIVRSALPDVKKRGIAPESFKDKFPLKCKTNVVEITAKDLSIGKDKKRNADKLIGDAMAECWFLFQNGDANPFPSTVWQHNTVCLPCARIHLTEEAKKELKEKGGKIDIEKLLNDVNLFDIAGKKTSYLNYLNGAGDTFYPFNPMGTGQFNLKGDNFTVEEIPKFTVDGVLKRVFWPKFMTKKDSEVKAWGAFSNITLPKYLEVDGGDLIITVGVITTPEDNHPEPNHIPYMFYFQNGQKDYMKEFDNAFLVWDPTGWELPIYGSEKICNMWDGVPA